MTWHGNYLFAILKNLSGQAPGAVGGGEMGLEASSVFLKGSPGVLKECREG